MTNIHVLKAEDAISRLNSASSGMPMDAPRGENHIFLEKKRTMLDYLMPLLSAPLLILFAISVIAAFLAEEKTLGTIALAAFLATSYIWYYAYRRSLDKMDAMRQSAEGFVRVIREGKLCLVASENLVVGDIVLLQQGDSLPADCRVLSEHALVASESAVFGKKGRYVAKTSLPCDGVSYYDADNMLWAGSVIHEGRCRALVVAVGVNVRIASLGEKEAPARLVEGEFATLLKRLTLITSASLLGLLFLVTVFGFTPLSSAGLFHDWLLAVSFAATGSAELLGLILTVALSRATYQTRGLACRKIKTAETMTKLNLAIVSVDRFRDDALEGVRSLLVPRAHGAMIEEVTPNLSKEGERILRNALVAMGGLSHPTSQSELLYGEKTSGDHIKEAFDRASLSLLENSYRILYAATAKNGISYGIFRREDGVFVSLCGDCKTILSKVGFVYEGETIRPITEDDTLRFAKKGAIGVAIGVLEAEIANAFENEEMLFAYLSGKLVFEGAAIVSRGVSGIEETRDAFAKADVTLAVVTETEEDRQYVSSLGAEDYRLASEGFLYISSPTRRELFDYIKNAKENGKTVLFEGNAPSHLALMKEADISLACGEMPPREKVILCENDQASLLKNGTAGVRLFADWVSSTSLLSLAQMKAGLSDAFYRAQNAILYLFTVLAIKLMPTLASIILGKDVVTAMVFMLLGFGFDTLAVFAILFRHGKDGIAPYTKKGFLARLYAALGGGFLIGSTLLTFALVAARFFSLSAEIFSSVALLAVSLIVFLCHYILPRRTYAASLSLGNLLTVGGGILVFVLLFVRGSFGKFGFLFLALTAFVALGYGLLSRLIFWKKGQKPRKK